MKKANLNYLTVQDVLWINLQLCGKVNPYSFAKLEEATFYQYAYGASSNVLDQAARFHSGFFKMLPFSEGNAATAFVGLASFLQLNGYEISVPDTAVDASLSQGISSVGLTAITRKSEHHGHALTTRQAIESVIKKFPGVAKALLTA